jgi:hypothetical protein
VDFENARRLATISRSEAGCKSGGAFPAIPGRARRTELQVTRATEKDHPRATKVM